MTHRRQYDSWIADAALGALNPRRERELLAHAGECDACRKAYQHARELTALVDRGVESLVAGEPSPHFATRLRARIAEEAPQASFAWLTWKPLGLAAVAVTILAVLAAFWLPKYANRSRENKPTSNFALATSIAGTEKPVAQQGQVPTVEGSALARAASAGGIGYYLITPSYASHQHPSSTIGSHHSPADPEVLVPPGQLDAVMHLAADISSGRIDGKQFLAEQAKAQQEMDKPIEIRPIDIEPIKVAPVVPTSDTTADEPTDSGLH